MKGDECQTHLMLPHAIITDKSHYQPSDPPEQPSEELLELEQQIFRSMPQFRTSSYLEDFYNHLNFGNLFALPESHTHEYVGFNINMSDLAELVFVRASSIGVCYSAFQYLAMQHDSQVRFDRLVALLKESRKCLLLADSKDVDMTKLTFDILPNIENEEVRDSLLKICITSSQSQLTESQLRYLYAEDKTLLSVITLSKNFTPSMFDDIVLSQMPEDVDTRIYNLASNNFLTSEMIDKLWGLIKQLPTPYRQSQTREFILRSTRESRRLFSPQTVIEIINSSDEYNDERVDKILQTIYNSKTYEELRDAYARILGMEEGQEIDLTFYSEIYRQCLAQS